MEPGSSILIPNMQGPAFPYVSATILRMSDRDRMAQVRITEGKFAGWLVSVSYNAIERGR